VLLCCLLAWPLLAWVLAEGLIVRPPQVERADAIVMLSGSEVYRERAEYAAQLFKAGRAPRVVLTNDAEPGGWSQARGRTVMFVERARDVLTGAGVPQAAIEIVPGSVASTYDEASAIKEYARTHGWRTLIAVTSGYHSRRAWWTLRRVFAGSDVTVSLAAVETGAQSPSPWTWWLHAAGWRMVAGEYVKLVYYRLHY
jgi:uncharacterized SAM-binding protein YcdF (DUF218 family)